MNLFKTIYLIFVISLLFSCNKENKTEDNNNISVSSALSSENDSGFLKAYGVHKFKFPEDNGPHYGYRTEWWYFTGNLKTSDDRKFGYQLTFFRNALDPDTPISESGWRSNQIYMAHFTVTDISENKFYYFERFSRSGNQLAGSQSSPFRVWLENWSISEISRSLFDFPKVKISASQNDISLELTLEPLKNIVLQGDNGYSRKGEDSGNASYYYSVSRLMSDGFIKIGDYSYYVNGYSWLDREWSTSALSAEQKGWDWFSIQLDNSYEIMYYQMRRKDGSADRFSRGTIIDQSGNSIFFGSNYVRLDILDNWIDDLGKKYPSGWTFEIPSKKIKLKITPAIKDQELNLTVKYWEGAVNINGYFNNTAVKGNGYVELTGYSE